MLLLYVCMCVYTHIFTPQVLEIEDNNLMFINYYVVANGFKTKFKKFQPKWHF